VSERPVDVYWAPPVPASALAQLLAPHERTRRDELHRRADRDRFVTGRALLRIVVGDRLALPPREVDIDATCATCGRSHGRPQVRGANLQVSVAHAADRVMVAVTQGSPIGIDVEPSTGTTFAGFDEVALTAAERTAVAALPQEDRERARTDLWVKKEAALKLNGGGLRQAPEAVETGGLPIEFTQLPVGESYRAWLALPAGTAAEIIVTDARALLAAWAVSTR
jgi:4'-phosphopantetheinyl transferase